MIRIQTKIKYAFYEIITHAEHYIGSGVRQLYRDRCYDHGLHIDRHNTPVRILELDTSIDLIEKYFLEKSASRKQKR